MPRAGGIRHDAGDEHWPRRFDDNHARQLAARCFFASGNDGHDGQPERTRCRGPTDARLRGADRDSLRPAHRWIAAAHGDQRSRWHGGRGFTNPGYFCPGTHGHHFTRSSRRPFRSHRSQAGGARPIELLRRSPARLDFQRAAGTKRKLTMFALFAFLIFTAALGAAAYYVWSVPRQEQQDVLLSRLRELRLYGGARSGNSSDLVRREQRGGLAPIGDFPVWIGGVRRLQDYIDQANLKYRA